jgi:5,10-methylene-tetrahydrofolate dehydrogenase/methenyl tetrahydrofolate cyclohydrolase
VPKIHFLQTDNTRTKRIGVPCRLSDNAKKARLRMRGLYGKTAIVAGGSTLIGQSVAVTLAGYGCNVVIAGINVAVAKRRPRS